jgi:hypothetical protein
LAICWFGLTSPAAEVPRTALVDATRASTRAPGVSPARVDLR